MCSTLLIASMTLSSCAELGIFFPDRQGPGNSQSQGQQELPPQASINAREARGLAVGHGLTGMRALPPGIQRNLARGKPLPPGIARQVVPGILLNDLPNIPDHEWRIAGRDLILIAIGTLIVVEILEDVFD
jgi:hypothetical protein